MRIISREVRSRRREKREEGKKKPCDEERVLIGKR
jgi:hypothetical protein